MSTEVSRILKHTLRVLESAPLVWLAVLVGSLVPTYPRSSVPWLLTCGLLVAQVGLTSVAVLAVPYLVLQAQVSEHANLASTWKAVKPSLPRLLVLYLILIIPLLCLAALYNYLIRLPDISPESIAYSVAAKYLILPFVGAIMSFSLAGISIDRLNGFHTLVNAVSISFKNVRPCPHSWPLPRPPSAPTPNALAGYSDRPLGGTRRADVAPDDRLQLLLYLRAHILASPSVSRVSPIHCLPVRRLGPRLQLSDGKGALSSGRARARRLTTQWSHSASPRGSSTDPGQPGIWTRRDNCLGWPGGSSRGR